MTDIKKLYLTPEQLKEKEAELHRIINVDIPNNSREIEEAKALGDLSENAEYHAAKDLAAKLEHQRREVDYLIHNATIITENTQKDIVEIGHTLDIVMEGTEREITILGYGNGKVTISHDAPLAKALLGRRPGDTVSVDAPKKRYNVTINSIH